MRFFHLVAATLASTFVLGAGCAVAPSAVAATPTSTSASPARCAGDTPSVSVFARGVPALDWRENLVFDGRGTMWVSDVAKGTVAGYAPDGTVRATVAVPSPGGLRVGKDGLIYVASGEIPIGGAGIERFDPTETHPTATSFATGLGSVNGLAEDADGNFYTTAEFAGNVTKIRPDGTIDEAWSRAADVTWTNGAFVDGDTLYVGRTADLTSTIARIPLADPSAHSVVTKLSPNILGYQALDDLTVVGDDIYAVGFLTGELLRVNKTTGTSCVVATGLQAPTSVRVPVGFGDHDPSRELFVTEASGRIVDITL